MNRYLNWYGWSIYTIAAVYESDAAAREVEKGLVNIDYMIAAFNCEKQELERDEKEGIKPQ